MHYVSSFCAFTIWIGFSGCIAGNGILAKESKPAMAAYTAGVNLTVPAVMCSEWDDHDRVSCWLVMLHAVTWKLSAWYGIVYRRSNDTYANGAGSDRRHTA